MRDTNLLKNKVLLIILISLTVLIAVFFIFVASILYSKTAMPIHPLFITKLEVTETTVNISGDIAASAPIYRSFKYEVDGKNMYVKVYYSLSSLSKIKSGSFNIKIDGDFTNLENIYIQSGDKNDLIWSKTS